jgi:hypothetical protein
MGKLTNSSVGRETDIVEHQGIFVSAQGLNLGLMCVWLELFPILLVKAFWGWGKEGWEKNCR